MSDAWVKAAGRAFVVYIFCKDHRGANVVQNDLKERILKNAFASRLLEYEIDREAYNDLVKSLSDLSVAWKGVKLVEKEIIHELYVLVSIIRNRLEGWRRDNDENRVAELEDIFIEIDRLVMEECLWDPPA